MRDERSKNTSATAIQATGSLLGFPLFLHSAKLCREIKFNNFLEEEKMRTRIMCAAAGLCLVLTLIANATPYPDTVVIKKVGQFTDGTIKIWGGGRSGLTGYGGFYLVDKIAGTGLGENIPNGQFNVFCIDLAQSTSSSFRTYNVVSPTSAPVPATYGQITAAKLEYLSELLGRFYSTALTSGALAEAMSAAVWEIVYEPYQADASNYDVTVWNGTANSFKCINADTATANYWLSLLDGTGPKANLRALTNECYQDFLTVPEPATITILGLGILALLKKRR